MTGKKGGWKRRNTIDIALVMLKALIKNNGRLKLIRLFYATETSHKRFKIYLGRMINQKMLEIVDGEIVITEDGRKFYRSTGGNKRLMGLLEEWR